MTNKHLAVIYSLLTLLISLGAILPVVYSVQTEALKKSNKELSLRVEDIQYDAAFKRFCEKVNTPIKFIEYYKNTLSYARATELMGHIKNKDVEVKVFCHPVRRFVSLEYYSNNAMNWVALEEFTPWYSVERREYR